MTHVGTITGGASAATEFRARESGHTVSRYAGLARPRPYAAWVDSGPAGRTGISHSAGRCRREPSRVFRKDAEQQPGRVTHYPPGVHLLYKLSAEPFQPGDFRRWVVGWMSKCTLPCPGTGREPYARMIELIELLPPR